ncbi:MAG: DUF167 domain-containing protein [Candidatus Paceibacteria bacterium]
MYIKVAVTPAAKRERFAAAGENTFTAAVREPAKQNLANRRVVQLVAEHFSVSPRAVRIVSGHHSPRKVLAVEDPAL